MDLAGLVPDPKLSSTGYCLGNAGEEYLVYLPKGGEATVDLSAAPGPFAAGPASETTEPWSAATEATPFT